MAALLLVSILEFTKISKIFRTGPASTKEKNNLIKPEAFLPSF